MGYLIRKNRAHRWVFIIGLVLCILGVAFAVNDVRRWMIPVKNAVVLEITDSGYIHGAGDDIRNEYTEDVAVQTDDGEMMTITIKNMDER